MMLASPLAICCMPIATVRSPEPQSWLSAQAVFSAGMPAAMAACRAGFWPVLAVSTWPKITSSTSPGSTLARSSAAAIATLPSSCAGVLAKAPLKVPTGVRAADTITMSLIGLSSRFLGSRLCSGVSDLAVRPGGRLKGPVLPVPTPRRGSGRLRLLAGRGQGAPPQLAHSLTGAVLKVEQVRDRFAYHGRPIEQRTLELLDNVLPGLREALEVLFNIGLNCCLTHWSIPEFSAA